MSLSIKEFKKAYKFALVLALSVFHMGTAAQVAADSIAVSDSASIELKEVVIEANRIIATSEGLRFLPSKREKEAAYDASSLMRIMNLTQINVDPASGDMKTLSGTPISIYIDYVPASSEDAKNLLPEDVISVEFFEYPKDPRFRGDRAVLNFKMKKYEWGGYTRLKAMARTLSRASIYNGGVYSRFNRKKMTYDFYAGHNSLNDNHAGGTSVEHYNDIWYGGVHHDYIERRSDSFGKDRQRTSYITGQVKYQTEKTYLQHTLSYGENHTPGNWRNGTVTFSPSIISGTETSSLSENSSRYPIFMGYDYFEINSNALFISYYLNHSRNHAHSEYTVGDLFPIISNADEKSWSYQFFAAYSQAFMHDNKLQFQTSLFGNSYDSDYTGSYTGNQTLKNNMLLVSATYVQNFGRKLYMYAGTGATYSWWQVNELDNSHSLSPSIALYADWKINSAHTLSSSFSFGTSLPESSSTNTVLQQSNELAWTRGNPDLKLQKSLSANLTYNWLMSKSLTFTTYSNVSHAIHPSFPSYAAAPEELGGIITGWINERSLTNISSGATASWRGLENKLSVKLDVYYNHSRQEGTYPMHLGRPAVDLSANFSTGTFTLSGYYKTPGKSMIPYGWKSTRSRYGIELNYRLKKWNFNVQTFNWFNTHEAWTSSMDAPHYSNYREGYTGASYAAGVNISVSYTFNYGKQIAHDSELDHSRKGTSAIMR